ncbi:MAG: NADH-quinone oxidoreductase subunit M [Cyclobacteriaceae bacterium]
MADHLLSLLIFMPLVVALVVLCIPAAWQQVHRISMIVATGLQLLIAGAVYLQFDANAATTTPSSSAYYNLQLVERADWISLNLGNLGHLSIDYFVAVDGISLPLVVLSTLILLIAAISSWTIPRQVKGYALLFLLLSASVVGCFVALDFFLFYLFFEFMLLPMYFLIGIWGGKRREYASIKFFLYTLTGSIFILIAMIGLYISVIDPVTTGEMIGMGNQVSDEVIASVQEQLQQGGIDSWNVVRTFDMVAMTNIGNYLPGSSLAIDGLQWGGIPLRWLAFWALLIGFAIKLPSVPLHTWLPDAHVEAPTAISVVLAGLLLKIGGYGIFRTAYSMFPEAALRFAWWVGFLGVISILYGAFNALAMRDLKKMIAYSSVSHMGFVLLGLASLTSEGVSGGLYQMFSHGFISPLLFLLVGVLYDRTHDRMIAHYGGLTQKMPYFTVLVIIAFFASLGLPGFSGFIAEVLTLLGAFNSATVNNLLPRWMAVFATLGLILGAGYYLWTLQRMFFGQYYVREERWTDQLKDLSIREYIMLVPLALATLIFGIAPSLFLDVVGESVRHWVTFINEQGMLYLEQMIGQ